MKGIQLLESLFPELGLCLEGLNEAEEDILLNKTF